MNERKINVLEVGEYKKNLEDVTHYIDDCINRIYGGIKALTSQNIIEGEISNTLEDAYEELSKIRTEVNEELDSFTGWIGKNIEDTTLLDERHARELENELNSMDFFKDGYTISGGNAFLTGDNNMKFVSSTSKITESKSNGEVATSSDATKATSSDATKATSSDATKATSSDATKATSSDATKATSSDATKATSSDATKATSSDATNNSGVDVNSEDQNKYIVKEYRNADYRKINKTDFITLVHGATENKFNLKEFKEINEGSSYQNFPFIEDPDKGGVPSSPKEFAIKRLDSNYDSNSINSINKIPDNKLAYQFVETYEIDGQKKSFSYISEKVPTNGEHYKKVVSFLEENTNPNSQISRVFNESGINIVEKAD